jgi:2-dehydropantoate 2-reductase
MKFDILGAGSLGLLWAGRLARAGHDVRMLLRNSDALRAWETAGSRLTLEQDGIVQQMEINALVCSDKEPLNHLIVATKVYAVPAALAPLAGCLDPQSAIVMLQNGLGSQQYASDLCPDQQVLWASVTDGAYMAAPGHVIWAGKGITRIGDGSGGTCPAWLQGISPAALAWQWEPNITAVLWQKLAINCAINPFTALFDCPNGQVPARAGVDLSALISELQWLLRSQNCSVEAAKLPDTIAQVIRQTAANSSSMRQDLQAGRRTEIDYILGHACRTAARHGIEVPAMQRLYAALKTHLAMHGLPTN